MIEIIVTLLIAALGGVVSMRLKLPAGTFFGALLATAVYSVLTGMAFIPRDLRTVIQMFTGIYIGAGISGADILGLRKLIRPAIVLLVSMAAVVGLFSRIMLMAGGLDVPTALLACAPGGLADSVLIADDVGADATTIAVLHLGRILFIFIAVPAILRRRFVIAVSAENSLSALWRNSPRVRFFSKEQLVRLALTAAAGILPGFVFWRLGIKAGALLGGLLGSALFNMATGRASFPKKVKVPLRVVTGAYIGQQITFESLLLMKTLLFPLLIQWAAVLVFMLLVSYIVRRFGEMDKVTSVISCVPGGLQEMVLLAEDLKADVPKVILLQTLRQVAVLVFFPVLIAALNR